MKQKQRKRGAKRIFAGAMAVLMVLSAVDVSGWGVMNAKAEESAVEKAPQNLSIIDENAEFRYIILNGELQDDGVSDNANTLYAGTNWYYDREKNQLVLQNASVQHIIVEGGDLTVLLSGENTVSGNITSKSSNGEHTLELKSDNSGSLTVGTQIGDGTISDGSGKQMNLKITDATVYAPEIVCKGSLKIENSHVIVSSGDSAGYAINAGCDISITNSYVEAKIGKDEYAISSKNGLVVSNSQIMACNSGGYEDGVIKGGSFSDAVVTKQYGNNETKSVVYGNASLIEKLTIPNNGTIVFMQGASITNQELLAVEDGANILVNGYMIEDIEASDDTHTHNKDGDITYTWEDDNNHIKNVACKDCPIGYVTKETESHSIGENGFCACNEVYQPAKLTTDKYDMDGNGSEDEVYEISNAGQLYWFAGLVNGTLDGVEQNTSANAILMKDITVNENLLDSLQYDAEGNVSNGSDFITWTPIADCMEDHTTQYSGTFDGNNKTVSGLYFNNGNSIRIGLFGSSEADGNIKNVGVVDSYFKGKDFVGGVCGRNDGTITNCYNAGNLTAIDPSAAIGGICGYNGGTIANCYNTGTVTATGSVASVGGVCGCSIAPISNCYNIGTVTATSSGADISGICGYYFGPVTNCYYLADTEDENGGKTAAQFASGEIAYLLSQGCSTGEGDNTVTYDGSIWGQTIGTDNYPTLGGAKVYKNAIYKGCEGKSGEPVSYEYSNTEKNTYGEHPDADNDGKCDDCGQYIDGIGAKLAGYSLSLTGNIGVNFYMELSDDVVNDESVYMNFTLPNGTTSKVYVNGNHEDGSTATTDTTVKNGVTYYVFTCEVAAKEMTSDIQAQMIGNNGEKKGTVHTYTVKEYADYILSHMSAEESDISKATIQLVKGMLNYGGAAQKYFGYKTDKLASDGLTLTGAVFNDTSIINIITNDANKASVTYDNAKVTFKSAYLSLNSTTDLCVSVQFADDVTVKEDMFAIRCNTDQISKDQYEVTKVNEENCYKITLHGVKASQLNEKYAFCVELSDTEYAELAYGTNSYAYTVMSSACDNINNIESLREVVKALYAYGSCSQEYEYYKNEGSN
ncbi:MAG TPA: hypothetical protein DIV56_01810 [Lachnospiraceae bacterium]|nr:hypothetical protein [Lachnospiraceae bacterium]